VNGIPHFTKGSPEHSARQREHQATRRGLTVEQMLARKAEREREEGRIDRARKRATKVGTTPRCMVRHLRAELRRGTCFYCGDRVGRGELDHVIPLSRGGSHSEGNTVLACRTCNQSKGNLFVTEWLLTPRKASRHLGLRNNGTPTACPFVALDALALLLRFVAQQDYVQERCLLRVVAA
jgi:5-methylcytosine-specific restriction endonuclease McrA